MALNITSLSAHARIANDILQRSKYKNALDGVATHVIQNAIPDTEYKVRVMTSSNNGLTDFCTDVVDDGSVVNEVSLKAVGVQKSGMYCESDMAKLLTDAAAQSGQYATVEEAILTEQATTFSQLVEKALFTGDTSQVSNNKVDGLLTLAGKNQSGAIKTDVAAGTAIRTAIEGAIIAIPTDALSLDGEHLIFLGQEKFNALRMAYVNANLYNYPVEGNDPYSFTIPGYSNIRAVAVKAMNGTNKGLVTPAKNIITLSNMTNEAPIYWDYDPYKDKYISRIKQIVGIAVMDMTFVQLLDFKTV